MTLTYPVVQISTVLLEETGRLLATFSAKRPSEGIVYWFGREFEQCAMVTLLIVPRAESARAHVVTSAAANAEVMNAVVGTGLILLGQAHSHPGENVEHSDFDDIHSFAQFPGAISLVVPHYSKNGVDLSQCGLHRHLGGRYERITTGRVSGHLLVAPIAIDLRKDSLQPGKRRRTLDENSQNE